MSAHLFARSGSRRGRACKVETLMLRREATERGRVLALERVEGRPHHVIGIGRANRFRDDILHPERLEDRAHRAAGNDAGAGRRGSQKDTAGAVATGDVMVERPAFAQRHARPARAWRRRSPCGSPRALRAPCRGQSRPGPSDRRDDERRKAEAATALTTLATRFMCTSLSTNSLSRSSRSGVRAVHVPYCSSFNWRTENRGQTTERLPSVGSTTSSMLNPYILCRPSSETQATLAGGIGQCFYATMIKGSRRDRIPSWCNAFRCGTLLQTSFPTALAASTFAPVLSARAHVFFKGRCACNCLALGGDR